MPQVDFYVLHTDAPAARREFVARLLGKIQQLGKTAWVAVADMEEARLMDRLLWEVPPESFLPHNLVGLDGSQLEAASFQECAVLISPQAQAQPLPAVYINLRQELPPQHGELQRLVEVVIQEPSVLSASRRNYRFYREQGYEVKSHHIRS